MAKRVHSWGAPICIRALCRYDRKNSRVHAFVYSGQYLTLLEVSFGNLGAESLLKEGLYLRFIFVEQRVKRLPIAMNPAVQNFSMLWRKQLAKEKYVISRFYSSIRHKVKLWMNRHFQQGLSRSSVLQIEGAKTDLYQHLTADQMRLNPKMGRIWHCPKSANYSKR